MAQSKPHSGIALAGMLFVLLISVCACKEKWEWESLDEDAKNDPGTPTDYFADNGLNSPVGFIQHPNAEHYEGVTYIAYQGPHEDPYVCAYDHALKQWTGPVHAGINLMGRTPDPVDPDLVDNHGTPALVVDGEGYIHLVFGGHGGYAYLGENLFGRHGKGKQTHVVSKNPRDISEWKELENISPFGTYNQLIKMDNGDIYLFYRHGSHKSDWVYQKSTDNARSFATPVPVLKTKLRADNNTHDAWYAHFNKGPGHTIMATYAYHGCKEADHSKLRINAYYMKMDCLKGSWENAAGERLTIPVTKEAADTSTMVFNSGGGHCNHGICRFDETGTPHLLFKFDNDRVWYTRWTGDQWQQPSRVTSYTSREFADMIILSATDINILVSGTYSYLGGEVSWWQSSDGGLSWQRGDRIVRRDEADYRIGVQVRNYHPDGMFTLHELDRTNREDLYRKVFLWGANGFVQRTY